MSEAVSLVRTVGLTKTYTTGKLSVPALSSVTLELRAGEFVALVGRSGSGKSTLLNLLGGLDRPTAGSLSVDGRDLTKLKEREIARYRQKTVGMIFQSFNLLPQLTALQNILVPVFLADGAEDEARKRAQMLLERVGLTNRDIHLPTELSGGEQQRVAIVRALINSPRLILADEPTGNLDTATGKNVVELLTDLCRQEQTTLFVITHDEQIAGKADRIMNLVDGRLQNETTV